MLRRLTLFNGFAIHATDGDIGKVHDIYFDDQIWIVRYFVVETGGWLLDRSVLLPPAVIEGRDWMAHTLTVRLTRDQVERSPEIDTAKPVSRQMEQALYHTYTLAPYWSLTGGTMFVPTDALLETDSGDQAEGDPHLRSLHEVTGYHIRAADGSLGHVEDFLIGLPQYDIHYLVVDTRPWIFGKNVLVPIAQVTGIHWREREVTVGLSTQLIQACPPIDLTVPLDRVHEEQVIEYYQQAALQTANRRA